MRITLDSYEIIKAIKMYLKARGINWSEDYIEMYLGNKYKNIVNLYRYNQDQHYDSDKKEWITDAKYEVDGLYVKRKKKGQKKYEYVSFDKSCIERDIQITEDNAAELEIWEDMG